MCLKCYHHIPQNTLYEKVIFVVPPFQPYNYTTLLHCEFQFTSYTGDLCKGSRVCCEEQGMGDNDFKESNTMHQHTYRFIASLDW